jgi:hypothetical protein
MERSWNQFLVHLILIGIGNQEVIGKRELMGSIPRT